MSAFASFRVMAQRQLPKLLMATAAGSAMAWNRANNMASITRLDYWEHDPHDFDVYIQNPTVDDLPVLLQKFDEEGLEVWPWIWTHPNDQGPHYVFLGLNEGSVQEIRRLRAASPQNNILVVASPEALRKATVNDPNVLHECHCGVVTDSSLALLNVEAKILMLQDERVIAYDHLTIVES